MNIIFDAISIVFYTVSSLLGPIFKAVWGFKQTLDSLNQQILAAALGISVGGAGLLLFLIGLIKKLA